MYRHIVADEKDAKSDKKEEIRDRNRRLRAEAAERRSKRRDELDEAQNLGLDAGEQAQDVLARSTDSAWKWIKGNFKVLQWVLLAIVASLVIWWVVDARATITGQETSDTLAEGLRAQQSVVGDPANPAEPIQGLKDPRRAFEDVAAAQATALEAYASVQTLESGSHLATLSELGVAGVLYDQGKYVEARTKYEAVGESPLAARDVDVRGRALEGAGLASEGAGELDAALAAFRKMGEVDAPRFKQMALLHESRVLAAQGKDEEAMKVAKELQGALVRDRKIALLSDRGYLASASKLQLSLLDPNQDESELLRMILAAQQPKLPVPEIMPEVTPGATPGATPEANPDASAPDAPKDDAPGSGAPAPQDDAPAAQDAGAPANP